VLTSQNPIPWGSGDVGESRDGREEGEDGKAEGGRMDNIRVSSFKFSVSSKSTGRSYSARAVRRGWQAWPRKKVFGGTPSWVSGQQLVVSSKKPRWRTGERTGKGLANPWSRKKIAKKAHAGHGQETIWGMSV
jgi:hypothetical protein